MDISNIVDNAIIIVLGVFLILVAKGKIFPVFKDPNMANSRLQKAILVLGVFIAFFGLFDLLGSF